MYSRADLRESLVLDKEEKIGLIAHKDEFGECPMHFTECPKLQLPFLKTGFILRPPYEDVTKKFLKPSLEAQVLQLMKCIAW